MCNKVYIHAEWGWHVSGKKLAKDFFRKLISQDKQPGVIWSTNILHAENIHISPIINAASVAGLVCLHCCCESTVLDRPSALQSLEAIQLLWATPTLCIVMNGYYTTVSNNYHGTASTDLARLCRDIAIRYPI